MSLGVVSATELQYCQHDVQKSGSLWQLLNFALLQKPVDFKGVMLFNLTVPELMLGKNIVIFQLEESWLRLDTFRCEPSFAPIVPKC